MKNGIVAVLTLASFCINFMMLLPPMRLAVPPVEDLYQKLLLPQNETLVSTDMVLVQNYTYVFSWSCSGQELQSFASQYFQQYRSTLPIQWQSGCNGIQWWNTNNDDDISWMKGGAALQGLFLVMLTLPVIFAAIYLYMAFKWAGDEKLRRLRSLPAVGCWLGFAVTWVMWFLLPMGYQCFPVDLQESIPQGFNNFDGRSFSIDPSAFSPTEYLRCTTAGQVSLSPSDMVRYAIWYEVCIFAMVNDSCVVCKNKGNMVWNVDFIMSRGDYGLDIVYQWIVLRC